MKGVQEIRHWRLSTVYLQFFANVVMSVILSSILGFRFSCEISQNIGQQFRGLLRLG